jgi:nitroreductase
MDALTAIMTRRSIRKYQERPVEPETIETLLRAAMAAPSAGNQQSWRFVVVQDRDRLDSMATTSPYAGLLERAPLAIAVSGETIGEKHPGYWVEDCSAAIENMLIAANALGLGAVWLGYHPNQDRKDALAELLDLPPSFEVLGVVAVGYPAEEKAPADRFNPDFVSHESWG